MTEPRTPVREFYRDTRYRTLGEQYNNLGNVEQGGSGIWPGQIGIGWNTRNTAFKAFATVEDGAAAQSYLIERYVFQKGHQTFHDIISTYAPTSDGNNVGEYTAHVSSRVDTIARGLGYSGPAITADTNLRGLLENPQYRDVVLAATVKAMNEVEVGSETSNRVGSAQRILAAIRSKYANDNGAAHTAFQRYSQAIGRDPGIRAPSQRRTGVATTSPDNWGQPDSAAIDAVGDNMMGSFVGLLIFALMSLVMGPDRARQLMGSRAPDPETVPPAPTTATTPGAPAPVVAPTPALPTDADLGALISPTLLARLGITPENGRQIDLFDGDHNEHISREEILRFDLNRSGKLDEADLPLIAQRLRAANLTVPATISPADLLTSFASLPTQPATPPAPATPAPAAPQRRFQ